MIDKSPSAILARMLWIAGVGTKEHAMEMAYGVLEVLEDNGWIFVRKDEDINGILGTR